MVNSGQPPRQAPAAPPAGAAGTPVRRRTLLRGGGTLLAAAGLTSPVPALTGCGSRGDGPELSFWNFYGPSDQPNPQSQWFVDLVAAWNKQNKTKVRLRYIPNAEYISGNVLQTAFSAGRGPDIFLLSPGDFLRYYNGKALVDLTPHLTRTVLDDYLHGVLDTRRVGNRIYGLPMEVEPLAMYYSVPAFERAKLSEVDLPKTWDQLLAVARKLTTRDRFGLLFETTPGYYQNFTWYPFMWMGGGSAVNQNQKHSAFDTIGAVAALKLWRDSVRLGVAPRRPRGTGGGDAPANLAGGYCAMQQTGIWSVADLAQQSPKFEYGIFPLPTPDGGRYTTDLGGWAFVANARGRDPETAARFIVWALGSDAADSVERGRRWNTVAKTNLPPRRSVQHAANAHGAFASKAMATFVNRIAPGGRAEPRYPPEIYKAISDAVQSCQLKGTDPGRAAADTANTINAFLKTYHGAAIL